MQRNIFDKTYIIFWSILLILSFNIVGSIFDIKLIFIGTAFSLFSYFLDNKNRLGQILSILLFIIIEINQNFFPLSTIFISIIVYLYIIPFFKQHLGCDNCHIFVNTAVFYIVYFLFIGIFDQNSHFSNLEFILLLIYNVLSEYIFFTLSLLF